MFSQIFRRKYKYVFDFANEYSGNSVINLHMIVIMTHAKIDKNKLSSIAMRIVGNPTPAFLSAAC